MSSTNGVGKHNPSQNIIDRITRTEWVRIIRVDETRIRADIPQIHIDAISFFRENGIGGYMTKKRFLALVYSMSTNELLDFEAIFRLVEHSQKFDSWSSSRVDPSGRSYILCTIKAKRGRVSCKVFTEEDLPLFFTLYQFELLVCNLSLTTLYQEALKQ